VAEDTAQSAPYHRDMRKWSDDYKTRTKATDRNSQNPTTTTHQQQHHHHHTPNITQDAEIIISIFIHTRGTVPITHKTRHQQANKISTNTNAKYAVLNNAIIRKCM